MVRFHWKLQSSPVLHPVKFQLMLLPHQLANITCFLPQRARWSDRSKAQRSSRLGWERKTHKWTEVSLFLNLLLLLLLLAAVSRRYLTNSLGKLNIRLHSTTAAHKSNTGSGQGRVWNKSKSISNPASFHASLSPIQFLFESGDADTAITQI